MASRNTGMLALLLAVSVSPAGAQQAGAGPVPPSAPIATAPAYELGKGDEVQVTLFGQPDMTVRARVDDKGRIPYPVLGSVDVEGFKAPQVASTIAARLKAGGYYTNPVVSVDVTSYVSHVFTLFGNLATPGVYPLDRLTTVAMAVARGGGARPDAADFALLRREGVDGEERIDFSDLSSTGGINTPLRAGDTLVVPVAPPFYVYGQVNSPGTFPIRGRMTLRQALIRAGGLTLAGSEKKVRLRRNNQEIRKVDLDQELKSDDVLYVGERFF